MTPEKNLEKNPTAQLELLAGLDPDGQPVMEKVRLTPLEDGLFRANHSPLFVRGLARDDVIRPGKGSSGRFEVTSRSGYLAIRVFRREGIEELAQWLTPQVEKLDGSLDLSTPNALVYSLHVNTGFSAIETLLDNAASTCVGSVWYYGNVYDPRDGVTPLNWWDEFINQI